MKKRTGPSAIEGRIQAPPSKSYAQRAIAVAAMAEGRSVILSPGDSDDVVAAVNVVRQLGARVEKWPLKSAPPGEADTAEGSADERGRAEERGTENEKVTGLERDDEVTKDHSVAGSSRGAEEGSSDAGGGQGTGTGRSASATGKAVEQGLVVFGGLQRPDGMLDCGEAGLSVRMFSAVASLFDSPVTLTGRGSLLKRPMVVIEESLRALGVECTTVNGCLPVTVRGPLPGGKAVIDGSFSSQVLTGILIASPYAASDVTLLVKNLKSRPYIDMTLKVMELFGVEVENRGYSEFLVRHGQRYQPREYRVEGDWSGAAFLLVAGATGGSVTVENLDTSSPQADRAIVDALERAGANVATGTGEVTVSRGNLEAFMFDATDCPDLFPPLVTLAAFCEGTTTIRGAERLLHKESNRAATLSREFGKLGVEVKVTGDIMKIKGGGCNGGTVESHGDHRIAMACATAAIAAHGEVLIEGAEAVAKSYPRFFEDMESLRKG
ncbi:MAG: 3-phosphoshikimate 1-carboxyvinyltransferase [Marinilabiliales bacterium]|nr:MAG: 3-phosphoshikimate 1-carboxyvinyltransferase [Marinilabiliales bacterium]